MATQTISKWCSSLAFRLPAAFAKQMRLEEGAKVQLTIDGKRLVIQRGESTPDANAFFCRRQSEPSFARPCASGQGARERNPLSVPAQGDIIAFKPELDAKRHEQQVPWLVVSVKPYNDASKLVMVCPITSHQGTATSANAAEVLLPANCGASGVVLTFQLQAIDWQAKVHVDGQRSGCDVEGGAAEFEDVFGVVDPFWTKAMAWHPLSRLINPM